MFKYITFLLFIIGLTTATAQESENFITTFEENSAWIEEFKGSNQAQRIELLKQRITEDRQVYYAPANPHGKSKKAESYKAYTSIRPLYFVNFGSKESLMVPANLDQEEFDKIISILSSEHIAQLQLKDDKVSETVYGVRGTYGIISLELKEKDQFIDLKQLIHSEG